MTGISLLVATPANAGSVTISYLQSILKLQAHLLERNWKMTPMQTQSMFLPHARNVLASLFHEQKSFSHLLFVDSDMGFSPSLIHRMLEFNKPIVGTMYPHRTINFENVAAAARKTTDRVKLERLSATFTTSGLVSNDKGQIVIEKGFAEVRRLGTGIILIRRDAMDAIAAIPAIQVPDPKAPTLSKTVIQCFMPLVDDSGLMLSEDISFCVRWEQLGGKMWACVDEDVTHTGLQNVSSRYLETLTDRF